MKRVIVSLVTALALVLAVAMIAQAQESTPSSTTNQQPTGAVNQAPTETPTSTTQPAPTSTTEQSTTTTDSSMPKTASPLPAMGLAGLAALVAGGWLSRRRRLA